MRLYVALAIVLAMAAGIAYAASEEMVHSITLPAVHTELKTGPGKEKTETLCASCHSVDYITMQPNFSKAVWTAEVNKMIKVMGAPIQEVDAMTIIDYLAAEYGTGK
ncbi:MAG: cytochrome c [Nitrospirae bacterium]|nr:cytochrome c [Nitrospirota bacterium]